MSFILTKESPFLEPLNKQFKKMEQSGVLESIRKRYYPFTIKDCKESKVALGYNQLEFPIIILFLGIIFSVILGCLETAFHKIFQNVIGGRVTESEVSQDSSILKCRKATKIPILATSTLKNSNKYL